MNTSHLSDSTMGTCGLHESPSCNGGASRSARLSLKRCIFMALQIRCGLGSSVGGSFNWGKSNVNLQFEHKRHHLSNDGFWGNLVEVSLGTSLLLQAGPSWWLPLGDTAAHGWRSHAGWQSLHALVELPHAGFAWIGIPPVSQDLLWSLFLELWPQHVGRTAQSDGSNS